MIIGYIRLEHAPTFLYFTKSVGSRPNLRLDSWQRPSENTFQTAFPHQASFAPTQSFTLSIIAGSFSASLPPACAKSGLPPPLPPTCSAANLTKSPAFYFVCQRFGYAGAQGDFAVVYCRQKNHGVVGFTGQVGHDFAQGGCVGFDLGGNEFGCAQVFCIV